MQSQLIQLWIPNFSFQFEFFKIAIYKYYFWQRVWIGAFYLRDNQMLRSGKLVRLLWTCENLNFKSISEIEIHL